MGYDIYGEPLRPGHCEVHPHVHEEYPCSLCITELEPISKKQRVAYLEGAEHDYQRRILHLEEGIRAIYAEAGDDTEIGEICRDLLKD